MVSTSSPLPIPLPCRARMVYHVTHRISIGSEDALEQVRSWSPMSSTWKTSTSSMTCPQTPPHAPVTGCGFSPEMRRNRSWSGLSSMSSSFKTMFGGSKKILPCSFSSDGIHGAEDDDLMLRTSNSIASSFSDALTLPDDLPNTELDSSISGISEAASEEAESAVSECGGAAPSAMLQAFASVQSWGRSAGEKGTDHYGAGYHTRVYEP